MLNWLEQEKNRPYHKIAELFPLMESQEFEQLKADVATNGLREAIWLHPNGSIIDGRNRHRACVETKTKPRFRTWGGSGSLVSFIVSMNLHRRHLTSSQRAVIALEMLPILETEARERQRTKKPQTNTLLSQQIAEAKSNPEDGRTTQQAAKMARTNRQYMNDAKKLQVEAPDLLGEIKEGKKTIPQAKRELVRRKRRETPPLPTDKYRILYADPPWQYGNAGIIGPTDNYGHAHRHYPSKSINALCEMGTEIKALTEDNAVLFLWVTSPMLEDGFKIIKAWGFQYKTSFVWDKIKHNYGHYNSVRHELLLVCTKGSCTPDHAKLYDSVQSIERSSKHSEKPEEFRNIIDDIYPNGKRIELFGRKEVKGWEVWGNEPTL